MLGSLITSRKAVQENKIVECSRLLIVINSGDLVLRCFRVLLQIKGCYAAQC